MAAEKHDHTAVPLCECDEVHHDVVRERLKRLPEEETLYSLADFFKVFGDPTRLNILFALDDGPTCGCDLAAALGMTKAAVSYQLKILRQNDLVRHRKQGRNVVYELSDDHVKDIIEKALEHLKEEL